VRLAPTGATARLTATVHNYGGEAARQKRVELWVGKAWAAAADPPFELRVQYQEVVEVPPGQSVAVTFPYRFGAAGDYAVQVRLGGDGLGAADARTVNRFRKEPR